VSIMPGEVLVSRQARNATLVQVFLDALGDEGGGHVQENLQLLCFWCNVKKGDRVDAEATLADDEGPGDEGASGKSGEDEGCAHEGEGEAHA
jgi:hypothetical protein